MRVERISCEHSARSRPWLAFGQFASRDARVLGFSFLRSFEHQRLAGPASLRSPCSARWCKARHRGHPVGGRPRSPLAPGPHGKPTNCTGSRESVSERPRFSGSAKDPRPVRAPPAVPVSRRVHDVQTRTLRPLEVLPGAASRSPAPERLWAPAAPRRGGIHRPSSIHEIVTTNFYKYH